MIIKVTHAGAWSTSEETYEISDDEIIGLLKRALIEIRDDEIVRKESNKKEDKINE